jgi:hypothetical protein
MSCSSHRNAQDGLPVSRNSSEKPIKPLIPKEKGRPLPSFYRHKLFLFTVFEVRVSPQGTAFFVRYSE